MSLSAHHGPGPSHSLWGLAREHPQAAGYQHSHTALNPTQRNVRLACQLTLPRTQLLHCIAAKSAPWRVPTPASEVTCVIEWGARRGDGHAAYACRYQALVPNARSRERSTVLQCYAREGGQQEKVAGAHRCGQPVGGGGARRDFSKRWAGANGAGRGWCMVWFCVGQAKPLLVKAPHTHTRLPSANN